MDALKADQILIDQLSARENINVILSTAVKEVIADQQGVTGLQLEKRTSGELITLACEGIFVQIGLEPNSQFVADLLQLNAKSEIVVSPKCETNVAGIFACGDVTDTPYKQIIISMGEGAKAGLASFEYLLQNK
jgi:alkyl hydroperoxide reductase subunit F